MPRTRDSQKSRLYRAERAAFDENTRESAAAVRCLVPDSHAAVTTDFYPSVATTQAYVDAVRLSAAFQRRWGLVHLTVNPNHGYTSRGGYGDLNLTPYHRRSEAIILHEIAHNLVGRCARSGVDAADHGPEFAATLLELVKVVMGREHAATLRAAYSEHRVKYRAGMAIVPKPSAERLARAKRVKVKRAKPGVGIPPDKRDEIKARKAAAAAAPMTYEQCYNGGWRSDYGDPSARMQNRKGFDHNAFDDGWMDAAAGREKFHRRDCKAHHNDDGGCGAA